MLRTHLALSLMLLFVGCWQTEPGHPQAAAAAAPLPVAPSVPPTIELVGAAEWEACMDSGATLEGGLFCDGQSLEDGVPLRYQRFPAIARDGSVLAVVEERDGWAHIRPGVRLIDRDGRTVQWLALDGTGDAARAAVQFANAALATRDWVALTNPSKHEQLLADDLFETTIRVGGFTVVYRRRNEGNWWLPPSEISVEDARGRVIAKRTDTERAWAVQPACNLPSFQFVGASAAPGVLLFMTGLGKGGHRCDGVEQPPTWHVLTFAL
ncbi:MAG: hypothetical protein JWO36_3185 [Myxococcales bacterium]|nr:hypothetical protein [Myxococcales bacterium]